MHDMSKFSPSEFVAYSNYFFNTDGTRKSDPDEMQVEAFKRAWCHHSHYNTHHYNYWVMDSHRTSNEEVIMPTIESIKEMAADMIGANAAQGNANPSEGAKNYYLEHSGRMKLHPAARSLLEKELGIK